MPPPGPHDSLPGSYQTTSLSPRRNYSFAAHSRLIRVLQSVTISSGRAAGLPPSEAARPSCALLLPQSDHIDTVPLFGPSPPAVLPVPHDFGASSLGLRPRGVFARVPGREPGPRRRRGRRQSLGPSLLSLYRAAARAGGFSSRGVSYACLKPPAGKGRGPRGLVHASPYGAPAVLLRRGAWMGILGSWAFAWGGQRHPPD